MDHMDHLHEQRLEHLRQRLRAGDDQALEELGKAVSLRSTLFLQGAGVGLHGERAAAMAATWIRDIVATAADATEPVSEWLEHEFEKAVRREFFAGCAALQSHLFSEVPPLPTGLDVAIRMLPAQRVSGDFPLVIRSAEWVVFGVGDATGHGTGAALSAALCWELARRVAQSLPNLDAIAHAFNHEVHTSQDRLRGASSQLVSTAIVLARWRPVDGRLEILNADSLFVLLQSGRDPVVDSSGWALGSWPEPRSVVVSGYSVGKGDRLVLASDGVTEQPDAPSADGPLSRFGLDRLVSQVRQSASRPPVAAADEILAAVKSFAGTAPQHDDQTVMVIDFP